MNVFQADIDGERFIEDLKTSVRRSQAFDAILRVRTSTGIVCFLFHSSESIKSGSIISESIISVP